MKSKLLLSFIILFVCSSEKPKDTIAHIPQQTIFKKSDLKQDSVKLVTNKAEVKVSGSFVKRAETNMEIKRIILAAVRNRDSINNLLASE